MARASHSAQDKQMFLTQRLANTVLTVLTNVLYGTALSDMETCYKVFPAAGDQAHPAQGPALRL